MESILSYLQHTAKLLRQDIVRMAYHGNGAHISSALSIIDMITVLYFDVMKLNPAEPEMPNRDRFILSKGHAAKALYSALARRGFFEDELLMTYGKENTRLAVHPEYKWLPGIEFSTGSLGHGLCVANGMALAARLDKIDYNVFVIMSDAECNEGSTWEAAMFASHHDLDNLVLLIDYNKFQAYGRTNEVMNLEPIVGRWHSFGWNVLEVNGNELDEIHSALHFGRVRFKPTVLICHTNAGHGLTFTENQLKWHYHNLDESLYQQALRELE